MGTANTHFLGFEGFQESFVRRHFVDLVPYYVHVQGLWPRSQWYWHCWWFLWPHLAYIWLESIITKSRLLSLIRGIIRDGDDLIRALLKTCSNALGFNHGFSCDSDVGASRPICPPCKPSTFIQDQSEKKNRKDLTFLGTSSARKMGRLGRISRAFK